MKTKLALTLMLFATALAAHAGPISKAGVTITKPGKYFLIRNLVAPFPTSTAITITAENVELDLAGFTISAAPNGGNSDTGIFLKESANNVRIRNGRIEGFAYGVSASTGYDFLLESVHVSSSKTCVTTYAYGSRLRGCTFSLTSNDGRGVETGSSGGDGAGHSIEECVFQGHVLGTVANHQGLRTTGATAVLVRGCQFFSWGTGIYAGVTTSVADNQFIGCTKNTEKATLVPGSFNQ
jgi:hypothetical protein